MIHRSLVDIEKRPVTHDPSILKKVLLEADELPGLTNFSQAVFEPGDSAPAHSHVDMWEVFFVRSGRARFVVDGVASELERDGCCVVEPGEVHEISNHGEAPLVLLYFGLRDADGAIE